MGHETEKYENEEMEYFCKGKKRVEKNRHYIIYERARMCKEGGEKVDFSLKIKGKNGKNVEK